LPTADIPALPASQQNSSECDRAGWGDAFAFTTPPPPAPRHRHCQIVRPPAHDTDTRMVGSSSTAAAAPAIVRDGADASPLLGRLMVEWADVFREEVLKKWLDPTDLALLARACWKCGEAVASAGVVRAGVTDEVPFKIHTFFLSGELLAWAKGNRCPWDSRTCTLAAQYGQLEALQWLRELDCRWDEWTCAHAAHGGHLEVLARARENGCPWGVQTCQCAARGGHLNVLQWARDHDCPWCQLTCVHAAQQGHLEMLLWARENGCPCPDLDPLFAVAAASGNVEMATWFLEQGCPLNGGLCWEAAKHGHLDLLMWLREHDCPIALNYCTDHAALWGHNKVVTWLGRFTAETWHTTTN